MKINLFKKIALCFILLLCVLSTCVFANDTKNSEKSDILASYETNYNFISSDLFLYDVNVEVSDIVYGNVFVYGSTVKITGEIYGDLFVFANSLEISEDAFIYGNVFSYANNIKVSGKVSDIYAMSDTFTLEDSATLDRNLYVYSNSVSLSGQILRDAFISATSLTFNKGEDTIIKNNLNYTSNTEANIPDGAVEGEINFKPIEVNMQNIILSVILGIIKILMLSLAIILISLWLAPNFKDRACEIISKKSFKAFGIGLLVFFGTILASIILLIFTYGFGIYISLIAIGLLILAYAISNTIFSMSIGKLLANKFNFTKNTAFVLFSLLIVLALELIKFVPYVGSVVRFIASILGIGILFINAYKRKDLVNKENN